MANENVLDSWWYYAKDQQVYGPLPGTAIVQLGRAGNIDPSFYVLKQGAKEWQPLNSVFHYTSPQLPHLSGPTEDQPIVRGSFVGTLSSHVTKAAGLEEIESLRGRALMSEIFRHHSIEEIDSEFSVGSLETTPHISTIKAEWPKPWIFFRSIVVSLVVYLILIQSFKTYENPNLIPSLLIVGSFAIPLSTLLLFFEFNIRQNVSLFRVGMLFLAGGLASLILAHPLQSLAQFFGLGFLGASIAALVEEPAKLFAVVLFARAARFHYIHNGLLFGAAVGTGFAAFESAGYSLTNLFIGIFQNDESVSPFSYMIQNINLRGVFSPFAHIVWTGIAAGALWKAKGVESLRLGHLFRPSFLRVFFIAVLLHGAWNSPFEIPVPLLPFPKLILIGVIGWVIVLSLVQSGIKQIAGEKVTKAR